VVIPDGEPHGLPAKDVEREALQVLPFFRGRKVITAASLSGDTVCHETLAGPLLMLPGLGSVSRGEKIIAWQKKC